MKKTIKNSQYNPNRIRESDMENSIFRPNDHMPKLDTKTEQVLVFTLFGKQDGLVDEFGNAKTSIDSGGFPVLADKTHKQKDTLFAEDREEAYAKSVRVGYNTHYFVKKGSDGRLYNPTGLYNESRSSKIQHIGMELWKFDKVDRNTFMHYLKFLSTGNTAWITTAQRELI